MDQIKALEKKYFQFLESRHADILNTLKEKKEIDDQMDQKLRQAIEEFKKEFKAEIGLKDEPAAEAG